MAALSATPRFTVLAGKEVKGGTAIIIEIWLAYFDESGTLKPDAVGPVVATLLAGDRGQSKPSHPTLTFDAVCVSPDDGKWLLKLPGTAVHDVLLPHLFTDRDRQPCVCVMHRDLSRTIIPLSFAATAKVAPKVQP